MAKKAKAPANPDIFPINGEVFVKHSPYVLSKIKSHRHKLVKSAALIAALLITSFYWGFLAPPEDAGSNTIGSVFYQFVFLIILGIIPLKIFNMKEYFKLKIVAKTNPIIRISHDGISWWERPEFNLPWTQIGGFAIKQSKIYALPRIAIFQQDRPHVPLICIDTALLDVKKNDMLAYLDARLIEEHKKTNH